MSMPTLRVIGLPLISNAIDTVINGLSSAIVPLNALGIENFQCYVCLENLTTRPHIVPECLHSFCGDCIKICITMFGNDCPACKVDASKRDLRQESGHDHD